MDEILTCAFCGLQPNCYDDDGVTMVQCENVGCEMFESPPMSEKSWNHRVYPPAVQAVLEAAKEYVNVPSSPRNYWHINDPGVVAEIKGVRDAWKNLEDAVRALEESERQP